MPGRTNQPMFQKVGECLYRHTSSKSYYALLKKEGKQIRRSLKTKDRKLAERRLKDFREKVGRLSTGGEPSSVTFGEFSARWLEIKKPLLKESSYMRTQGNVKTLDAYFGIHPLRKITRSLVDQWSTERSPKVSASSYNKEREALVHILTYAIREGILLDNCADHLPNRKRPKKELIIPSVQQFQTLVQTLRNEDKRSWPAANLVELLAYSGMRLGEATSILWEHVDFEKKKFTVTGGIRGTKNMETRVVPMFPALEKFLLRLWDQGVVSTQDRISKVSNSKVAIAKACKASGLPHFNHHSMRHFFVSNAIEVGVDFKTIAAWVGHKDGGILVAQTYGHLRDPHSHEMAKRMKVSV